MLSICLESSMMMIVSGRKPKACDERKQWASYSYNFVDNYFAFFRNYTFQFNASFFRRFFLILFEILSEIYTDFLLSWPSFIIDVGRKYGDHLQSNISSSVCVREGKLGNRSRVRLAREKAIILAAPISRSCSKQNLHEDPDEFRLNTNGIRSRTRLAQDKSPK